MYPCTYLEIKEKQQEMDTNGGVHQDASRAIMGLNFLMMISVSSLFISLAFFSICYFLSAYLYL